ncbi:ankyrin repeat domain-containing protein 50-like [Plakobranchus ocellatus]|uniref:Ankyrin repeat domain-containing protein 50-like n=1 Tax=Plakobranchus ocellatus TaxID=259542 RepID=A0AAV4B941_9GAST|nr:ankyrin repeat domain-containing protein 50-like [Plakobranchus ocellatus]
MGQAESKQEMFWEACGFGRPHLVEKFIEHGIDVNWVSSIHDCSPIHVASQGKPEVVKLLIDAGCDISVVDSRGNTAVHHAAMQGHADIIQMLVDAGADLNAQDKNGWTPLHHSAYYAHLRAVEVLVKNKCDADMLNKDGRSALTETARSKKYEEERVLGEIARTLIKAGCDVNLQCTDLGEANFTGLMFAAYHNHVDVATAFIDGDCNLNAVTLYTKWTALHWAADCGNAEMVYLLLDAGANPTAAGMRGEMASSRAKDPELKEFLENAERLWRDMDKEVDMATISSVHSVNAQASLDTAKALESLSTQAKNRDILSAPMPTMPVLGITSRSDPKTRYTRRDVKEVAAQSIKTNFPWKSYSKQTSPSPDRDGLFENGEGGAEEKPKLFPSQDDKTNAFMDSLAQRINYMTGKIANMGGSSADKKSEGKEDNEITPTNSEPTVNDIGNVAEKDDLQDSGLSSHEGSHQPSELTTPDNDGTTAGNLSSPKRTVSSPKSPMSPKSPSSPLKEGDSRLDAEADASIIEESHRGFSILKALQERRRRSMVLEDLPDEALPQVGVSAAANADHLRFMSAGGSQIHHEPSTPPPKKAEIISTV